MKVILKFASVTLPCLAAMLLGGCSKEAATNAPVKEVRGEAITPPLSTSTTQVASAGTALKPAPADTASVSKPTPTPPKPAAVAATSASGDDFVTVGFDQLAGFNYDMPDESAVKTNAPTASTKEQIPADIKALNSKRVALKGFMLPLKVEGGLITELLIMRDQSMCCYGTVPKINEWVSVKMTSKGVKPIMDQAVTIYGSLKVGEMFENGYLVGIYALDGEKIAGPLDL